MAKKKQPDAASEDLTQTEAAVRPEQAETIETQAEGGNAPEQISQIKETAGPESGQPAKPEAEAAEEVQSEERPEVDEALARRLSEAERELAETKDKYWRLAAEYDNFRKRTRTEKDGLYTYAVADTAEKFLPVYDNLERALSQQTQDAAYYKGVELIRTELLNVFETLNIHTIEALGRPFDPALHDAVMHIQDDSGEENMVAEVFKAGFLIGERVIRPAMVKVKN